MHTPHFIYACMITVPLITCVISCLFVFTPSPYTPVCSRYSTTTQHIFSLHTHGNTYHLFTHLSLHSNHMRLHNHSIRRPHHIYTACFFTSPPVICLFDCLYTVNICAYMLATFNYHTTYMQPAYSRHRLSLLLCLFVCFYIVTIYACMLTAFDDYTTYM